MKLEEILETTRTRISEYADGDRDKLFYANRYVFARLQLDERKVKTQIKKRLIDGGQPCSYCGRPFESKVGLHLHRVDGHRGYSLDNCVLMHRECHERYHAEYRGRDEVGEREETTVSVGKSTLVKYSKRYDEGPFLYWWDISPSLAGALDEYEAIEFAKKDTGERCGVPPEALKGFMTSDRQTSRGRGNWGIKVLKDSPEELAFEPAKPGDNWLFLSVVWLSDEED